MASGYVILILIFLFVFLGITLGIYCHFCADETGTIGRYYGSNENIAKVMFTAAAGVKHGGNPAKSENKIPKSRCRCSNKFKGYCKSCEGEDFVDDGKGGRHPDFSDFGGDRGLDPGWGNNPDPIRAVLGNGATASDVGGGGGGYDTSGMSDQ